LSKFTIGRWFVWPAQRVSPLRFLNGLDAALIFGLGSMLSIALMSETSPLPPTRRFNGELFKSVTCDASARIAPGQFDDFSFLNDCGVTDFINRAGM